MPKKNLPATSRSSPSPRPNQRPRRTEIEELEAGSALATLHDALDRLALEAHTSYEESLRFRWVEILLLNSITTPKHIGDWLTRQGNEKPIIKSAIDLYEEMARLIVLCEPDGPGAGPTCRVRLVDFDNLSAREIAFSSTHLSLVFKWTDLHGTGDKTARGVDLLTETQRQLYTKAKKTIAAKIKAKPTLQSLAAELLDLPDGGARRLVKALEQHPFAKADSHRDRTISMVNSFGAGDRSPVALEMAEAAQRFAQSPAMIETRKQIAEAVGAIAASARWFKGPESVAAIAGATQFAQLAQAAQMAHRMQAAQVAPALAEMRRRVAVSVCPAVARSVAQALATFASASEDEESNTTEESLPVV